MISIVIISKYKEDLKTISALLAKQDDFCIAGTGTDGCDAIRLATALQPNIIIADFSMQDIDSPKLAPIIKRSSPSTAFIVLYSQAEQEAFDESLRVGISGFLLREEGFEHLASAVRSVFYGGLYLSVKTRSYLWNYEPHIEGGLFSPTERCIIHGIILGHNDKIIARSLNMNPGSLRNCVCRVKNKTGIHNRTQITGYALLAGIINIDTLKIGGYNKKEVV